VFEKTDSYRWIPIRPFMWDAQTVADITQTVAEIEIPTWI